MSPRPTVAFDLDGTLVDTAPDLLAALNTVLSEAGLAPISMEDAHGLFGGGARVLIERGLTFHGMRPDAADMERMFARFLEFYEDHLADHSKAFPGAAEMLEQLAAGDAHLVVVTNKYERFAVKLLSMLGLAARFSVIAGPDTFGVRKPDPGHLLGAVARAGGSPARTIMIGDSMTDVATARAARVPVIAVSYGYRDREAAALGADRLIDRLDEVPAALAELLR
ncbi:MAG: phosphoglycolate phosphatase [Bradyrhizobiaceae bacterium]|nr:phosphoglycolate phosphatase [Bradyrhizobiaceae bacterium]